MSESFPLNIDEIVKDTIKHCKYDDRFDAEQIESMLREAYKLADEKLYPAWRKSDEDGVKFVDGKIEVPAFLEENFRDLVAWGWSALGMPEELGGMEVPTVLTVALLEIFCGANFPIMMCPGLTKPAARVLNDHAGEWGKEYATKMVAGEWTGTMCLTEPHAGTALGDIKTRAIKQDDGTYALEGQKIWITFGAHGFDGIETVHLVLAKTPDAPSGTKGISLFAVPTVLPNGERNDVKCIGIEHKMGIHGSPTCTMAFGGDSQCTAYLVGEECKGMRIMFEMMIDARIGVGIQAVSQLEAAQALAHTYAADRVQGVSIDSLKDPDAPRVTIDDHPPVQRLLRRNKALSRAMRHFVFEIGALADKSYQGDEQATMLLEFSTPLVKAWCSDAAFNGISECLQVFGGNGYLAEFAVGQYMRDNRIAMIYEGANEVQGLDLLGRQLPGKGGMKAMAFFQWLGESWAKAAEHDESKRAAAMGQELQNHLGELLPSLAGLSPRDALYDATPILNALGAIAGLAALCRHCPESANDFADEFIPQEQGRIMHLAKKRA